MFLMNKQQNKQSLSVKNINLASSQTWFYFHSYLSYFGRFLRFLFMFLTKMSSCANPPPWHWIPLITAYLIWVEPSNILNNSTQHLKPAGLLEPQDNSHLKACLPQRPVGCRNGLSLQELALFCFSTESCKTYLIMPTLSHCSLEGNCSCNQVYSSLRITSFFHLPTICFSHTCL